MYHLTNAQLIIGAFVLILGVFIAVKTFLDNRRKEKAPFRNYFGPEYDRDLLRQSSWCDEGETYDGRTRFEGFNVRHPGAIVRYSRDNGTTQRNCDRD